MNQETMNGSIKKIKTGISGLDLITHGGLPQGRTTLVSGTSGSAKTIFSVQYLINGITQFDENGVFVTFEETPKDIGRNIYSFNWHLNEFIEKGKLAFVDVSPSPSNSILESDDEYDFSALFVRIEHAIKKVNAKRISIDSISAIFGRYRSIVKVRRELFRIAAGLKKIGVTAVITAERTEEYGEVARHGVEEFVADNVIIMRNTLEEEKRRRTVEVLKFRGAYHQKGEFPFTISDKGIEVLPLSAMTLTQKSSNKRSSSGNKELDRMCGGGFYRDSVILTSGATGAGKTLMVTTFINEGTSLNEKCILFAFEESHAQLLRNAIGWGMNFREREEKGLLKVICTYPESKNLEDHLLKIKRKIDEFKPARIAVDSLSALERVSNIKSFREFVIGLTSFIKEHEITGLITATTPSLMGGFSITETHISTITDSIILLRYVELFGQMRRGLTVLKMRGSWHDKSIREYEIDDKGFHIGKAFNNVGGILAGSPIYAGAVGTETLETMFDEQ